MKKIIAIALALMLCVGVLSVSAFAAEGDTFTINVQVPEGTATPNIWAWGGYGNAFEGASWPGVAMTAAGDWYVAEVPAGTVGMLINTAGDADKSADVELTGDADVWVIFSIGGDGKFVADSVSYDAPGADTPADPETPDEPAKLGNYYVTGGAAQDTNHDGSWLSNWNEKNVDGQMTDLGGGKYQKVFKNVPAGAYELKVNDGTWKKSWGDNGNNYYFSVEETCDVTVTFTLNGEEGTVSVTGAGVPGTADFSVISVVVLMVLAATTTVVLVTNKKKLF